MWTKSPHRLGSNIMRVYVSDREGVLQVQADIVSKLRSPNSQNITPDKNSLTSTPSIEGKIFSSPLKLPELNRKN